MPGLEDLYNYHGYFQAQAAKQTPSNGAASAPRLDASVGRRISKQFNSIFKGAGKL